MRMVDGHSHDDIVDDARVRAGAAALLNGLDQMLRVVLSTKLAGASDAEIGVALRVSRRTATNRKAAAYTLVEELLRPLNHAERLALLDRVGPALHRALVQSRTSNSAT